jgi:hypothetical protein
MLEPYDDAPDNTGIAVTPRDELRELARQADEAGFSLAVHAIGDRANRLVLDVLAEVGGGGSGEPGPCRHRIEHVQLHRPQDLALFRELGGVASVQPVFTPTDWSPANRRWGLERCGSA